MTEGATVYLIFLNGQICQKCIFRLVSDRIVASFYCYCIFSAHSQILEHFFFLSPAGALGLFLVLS